MSDFVQEALRAGGRHRTRVYSALAATLIGGATGAACAVPSLRALGLTLAASLLIVSLWVMSPQVTLLGYVALRPLIDAYVFYQVGGLTVGQLWGGGLLVLCLAYLVLDAGAAGADGAARRPVPVTPVAAVLGYAVLTFTRPDLQLALVLWLRFASWVVLALACEQIARTVMGQVRIVKSMLVFSVLLMFVIAHFITQNKYGEAYYTRVHPSLEAFQSIGQGPRGLSAMAVFVIPFVLLAVYAGRRQLVSLALAGLLGIELVLSYRRTAYISFAIVAVAYVALVFRLKSQRGRISALVLFGATIAALYVARGLAERRFTALLGLLQGGREATLGTGGRVDFWSAVVKYAFSGPLHAVVGGGADTSFQVIQAATGAVVWAHNDFLEMLASGGVVMLVLYVLLLVWMVRSTWAVARDGRHTAATRAFALLATAGVIAFIAFSFLSGAAFSASTLPVGVLVGLVRGIAATPGHSVVDQLQQRSGNLGSAGRRQSAS